MKNIGIITGKDLAYAQDRDGGVSLFEKYIKFLLEKKYKVNYFTPLGYSGGEKINKKKIFQNKLGGYTSNGHLDIFRFNIDGLFDKKEYLKSKNKFKKRICLSYGEAKGLKKLDFDWDSILRLHIFHVSHAMGLILDPSFFDLNKTIIHPMMTGIGYSKYMNVPKEYLEIEEEVFRKVKIIQTPSEDEKKYLIKYYKVNPNKIIVNPRPYDEDIFSIKARDLPKKGEPIKIICANMIRPQKGQEYFIPFAEKCRENNIPIKIQLIGVNKGSYDKKYIEYYNNLKDEINEKLLNEYFIFYDVMNPEDLNKVMKNSHFSIIPSKYETFGKSALESLVTGLPTIAFNDIEAYKCFIEHNINGILIPRDNQSSLLFKSFLELINNPNKYKEISLKGIESGLKYKIENIFSKMEEDIKKII